MHLPVDVHRHSRSRDHPDLPAPRNRGPIGGERRGLILRTEHGQVVAHSVARADSFWSRFMGLMGRSALPPGEGLCLPGSDVHMFFMRFPIDCLFLAAPDADGLRRVVGVRHSLSPWRGIVWYVRGAACVVELPAGTLSGSRVREGDRMRLEPAA